MSFVIILTLLDGRSFAGPVLFSSRGEARAWISSETEHLEWSRVASWRVAEVHYG